MTLDGPHLARLLAASRSGKRLPELAAYVDALQADLESRCGTNRPDDFRARMDALKARHPSKLPAPAAPTLPPPSHHDTDEDDDA